MTEMMNKLYWQEIIAQMTGLEYQTVFFEHESPVFEVKFDEGLTDEEIKLTEIRYGFRFPPDLKSFLQAALPVSPRFPNWRSGRPEDIKKMLDMPKDGVLFDVEHNGFWSEDWGKQPEQMEDALVQVNELFKTAPVLIPVYGHRMLPAEPHDSGNPVFSVHQTDIIVYGNCLADYFMMEWDLPGETVKKDARPIKFWNIERWQEIRWGNGPCKTDERTLKVVHSEVPDE
jgi:hypothetical protein